jgi:ADP-ribose pyrophosphatase YjhB (NUDIX family)
MNYKQMISSPTLSIFDKKIYEKSISKLQKIYCRNCGKSGHLYKFCKNPIMSFGIILYRTNKEKKEYLIIRRKDSIGYVEFIRGKYTINNIKYILLIIDEMSLEEKLKILNYKFNYLWKKLWMQNDSTILFKTDYYSARDKFKKIKDGIYINNKFYNLNVLIKSSLTKWSETEWGFPKGRRNFKETDIETALREFKEETNIKNTDFILDNSIPRVIEEYVGSNNITYKHIYYLAKYIGDGNVILDYNNKSQITEISKIEFNSYTNCIKKFRTYHIEKKLALKYIHQHLKNQHLNQ